MMIMIDLAKMSSIEGTEAVGKLAQTLIGLGKRLVDLIESLIELTDVLKWIGDLVKSLSGHGCGDEFGKTRVLMDYGIDVELCSGAHAEEVVQVVVDVDAVFEVEEGKDIGIYSRGKYLQARRRSSRVKGEAQKQANIFVFVSSYLLKVKLYFKGDSLIDLLLQG